MKGSLIFSVEDIELFDKGFRINMLFILFQFEIFFINYSHILNMNERYEIGLNLKQFLIILPDLVIGHDWDAVVDLVPERVD